MQAQYETVISKRNLERIHSRSMSPAELIAFLEEGALYRSFADVLRSVSPGEGLAERLKTRLLGIDGQPAGPKEAEALRKNVSNWLRGEAAPQNREQLFKICFALELDEARAGRVLASASDTGIHYRDPHELCYAFALRTGLGYAEAVQLDAEMEGIYGPVARAAEAERAAGWKKREQLYRERRTEARRQRLAREKQGLWSDTYLGPGEEEDPPAFLTQQVYHRFEDVRDREGLRLFFLENSVRLGWIHESAYEKFWSLLLALQEPDDAIAPSGEQAAEVYSLDRIAEEYLRMHVPLGKNTRGFDYLQRAVKRNWPGATELQRMKSRKADVSRKALLLLFLITEDFLFSEDLLYSDKAGEEAAWYLPLEDESPRDRLEVTLSKVNLFLETYGMNQLDPGNPFDCLVLYALAADCGGEFLSDNFSRALEVLFSGAQGGG